MPRGRPPKSQAGLKGRVNGLRVIDRKPIRPLERQKMRPWLTDLLDKGVCNQLAWYKRRENLFRIMWKHAAGQTFNATCDASLFQRWAEHTGKFVQGDKPDAKKWKANFRCALHSLPDVEEDRDLRVKRGNNAFRVYKFLDSKKAKKVVPKKTDQPRNAARRNARVEDGGCSDGYSPSHDGSHSDWEMRSGEDREAVENLSYDEESDEQSSPLPKFDEICPFAVKATKFPVLAIPMISSSTTDDGRSYHLSIYQNDDVYQIVHQGWEAEDSGHSIKEYEFDPEPELDVQEEVVCSNTDVVCSNTDGPHVVVESEPSYYEHYYEDYTSMDLTEEASEI